MYTRESGFIKCKAGKGMFPDEYAVSYELSSGRQDSLFVNGGCLKFDNGKPNGVEVEALMKVQYFEVDDDGFFIELPGDGFRWGSRIRGMETDLEKTAR